MGYYSNVQIVVKETDYKKYMDNFMERYTNGKIDDYVYRFVTLASKNKYGLIQSIGSDTKFRVLTWECEKWYEDFEEVIEVRNILLNKMCPKHIFMRIGEGYGPTDFDVEYEDTLNNAPSWIVEPRITVNFNSDDYRILDCEEED